MSVARCCCCPPVCLCVTQGKIGRLVSLVRRHDPELHQHMEEQKLDARYYSLRWITTLLSR